MFLKRIIYRILLPVLPFVFVTMPAAAQEAAQAAPKMTSGVNQLMILMVVLVAVLAFVIWGLGQVLTALTRQVLDKRKQGGKGAAAVVLAVLLLLSQAAAAQTAAVTGAGAEAVIVEPNFGGLSSNLFYMFLVVVIAEVIAVIALMVAIRRMYAELMPQPQAEAAAETSRFSEWWSRMDKKLFTKAVPVAKEADVMMDHDYDGIKELDNALPPWWKYGFYVTIAIGLVYLLNFHVFGTGKNPTQEYDAEMSRARAEKELYEANNKDKIDENNVPMANETGLARGKEIFNAKCWSCHGKLGEGGAGPNMTDDYWLHKGSLNDIYRSIKVGYPDKGMQSWATDYTPLEMSYVASYIKTLKGTNPPGARPPQGELYAEEARADSAMKTAVPAPVTDSAKKTTAPAAAKDTAAAARK